MTACGGAVATPTPTAVIALAPLVPSPTIAPSPMPSASPSPTVAPRPTPSPAPTQPPEPTPTPAVVHIASTSGQTVYLYNSPTIGDRIQSYPEGTPLVVVGGDVEGDGLMWHFVRAPDGTEGYIPVYDTLPSS